jgi:hypothetical protein
MEFDKSSSHDRQLGRDSPPLPKDAIFQDTRHKKRNRDFIGQLWLHANESLASMPMI